MLPDPALPGSALTDGGPTFHAADPVVAGLTADSRDVRAGYLFAALPGARLDGRQFIPEAVSRGAVAVLAPPGARLPETAGGDVVLIQDDRPRRRFALLASRFHAAQPRTIAAVTGTSGKTSVVQFTRQLWQALGQAAASLGTLGVIADGWTEKGSLTTPDPVALHATLATLAARGIDHLAVEASSHGLAQYRLDGMRIAAAAFTNLSRDHLDYHGTMQAYFAAKARLFDEVLQSGGTAVLNADVPCISELAATCHRRGHRVLTYGSRGDALRLCAARPHAHGQLVSFDVFGRRHDLALGLIGRFQAHNVLCAIGLVLAGMPDAEAAAPAVITAATNLVGVTGRLQPVARHPNGAAIYVDYAHKPDALETVLTAIRPHTRDRLVVVVGCGGDRDPGKRPMMGEIATRLADRVIVTDDNPRSEDPAAIRHQVLAGVGRPAEEIGDRAEAIRAGIRGLGPDDVLLIAGKGHEQGQIVGNEVRPFDDAETARSVVEEGLE